MMGKFRSIVFILVVIALPFMLFGCGSSGGSGSESSTSSSTGTAAVLIKDAPTPEYDSIVLCISKATLEPGSVTLFESDSCVEIDLLDHQVNPFLLTVKDIPAGSYNQIILNVDDIYTEGGPCDEKPIKIPSGRVKINPQEPIDINSGDKIAITIDIQAKRSINLHPAGNSGKCIFRPVIIAEITNLGQIPPDDSCPRILKGTIEEINKVDDEVKGFTLKLAHDPDSQIDIIVDENTVVFDENGDFTTADDLEKYINQKVKVRGELQEDATILASVVAIGRLLNLHGTALTVVKDDNDDRKFEMELDPGQAIVDDTIDVIVDSQTLILTDCNTEVTDEAIKPGVGVRAIGKLSDGDLIAVVLFLEEQQDYGLIIKMTDIDELGYDVEYIPPGETESVTVFLPPGAVAKIEGDGGIQHDLLAILVNCDPRKARITLNQVNPTVVDLIEVQDEVIDGTIKKTDPDKRTIKLEDGTNIQVQDLATILLNGSELLTFDQLMEGDEITIFGLEACPDDTVDFYGFVIVVVDMVERGDEGCSQGYWKNHLNSWGPTGYNTGDSYNEVFGVPYNKTLLGALESGGGGEYALGRQAVAALLNATHPGVDHYYAENEVIDIVQDAYDTGDFEGAKNLLEEHISPCPLD
jgi:hypothetical protein